MKIVISGAGGMIGLALIEKLLAEGDEVVALVRKGSVSLAQFKGKIKIIECALSDYRDYSPTEKADIFFHLAWDKTSVAGRDDALIQASNIQYSLDAVMLAYRFGCGAFVGAGSQAEFGVTDIPLNENVPVSPQSCYGIAKYSAGRLTRSLCAQLGIRHNWARILSVYGENDGAGSLIMYLIRTLTAGETAQLTPCKQIWDYMYCGDTAGALCAIGKRGKDRRTYCLGSGKGRPLSEYVLDTAAYINKRGDINNDTTHNLERDTNSNVCNGINSNSNNKVNRKANDVSISHQKIYSDCEKTTSNTASVEFGAKPYYPHQPMHLVADITDLTRDTGFIPTVEFKDGIAKTVEWFLSRNK